jgi:hypothetical protein
LSGFPVSFSEILHKKYTHHDLTAKAQVIIREAGEMELSRSELIQIWTEKIRPVPTLTCNFLQKSSLFKTPDETAGGLGTEVTNILNIFYLYDRTSEKMLQQGECLMLLSFH